MDIEQLNSFFDYIINLNTKIKDIDPVEINSSDDRPFNILAKNINKLFIFINEYKDALHSYLEKNQNPIILPFDVICAKIIIKLEKILQSSICLKLSSKCFVDQEDLIAEINALLDSNPNSYNVFYDSLGEFITDKLISVVDILKKLALYHRTIVILGANGSGKTSFANFLRDVDNHIKVIPASKPIRTTNNVNFIYDSTIEKYAQEIFSKDHFKDDLLQKLIIGICSEHDDVVRKYYKSDKKDKSKFIRIKEIFESFFDVELDDSEFSQKKIMVKKKGADVLYDFNNMSEGERVAFFYIATTIIASPNSFIIVDEPENHLNPAIYNKIWDKLIEERTDCQFIFISHTMEFINARTNFELVKIKNFVYPDKFEFESFGDTLENIDPNFLVEIIGSRKPILFCEGDKSGYDYKIYEILFGDEYTIIPTHTCNSVINHVKSMHPYIEKLNNLKVIGIIDSDLKSKDERKALLLDNIHTLKCNEVEMLLIDENIFKAVAEHLFKDSKLFDDFKKEFFKTLNKRKNYIISRLIKYSIDNVLHTSFIDDKINKSREELKVNLNSIINGINIDRQWKGCDNKLSKIIKDNDFDSALRYCCLEHGEVIGGICNRLLPDYANQVLGVLSTRPDLQEVIKKKYIDDCM